MRHRHTAGEGQVGEKERVASNVWVENLSFTYRFVGYKAY